MRTNWALGLLFSSIVALFLVYIPAALALSSGPIGTMTATNNPTGWSIVSVNPSSHASFYSFCNNTPPCASGVLWLTPAGATALQGLTGSDVITVSATNAGGSGQGTATINFSPTVTIIPTANNVTANWQKAGLATIGGIPNRTTQCGATVTPSGVTPPAGGDDASKINTAIAACPAGQFVQLGAGTFQLDVTENVFISTGITLRGTGNCTQTSLGANPESTGGPFCATVIQMFNGTWPVQNGPSCGSTTGTPPNGTAPGSLGGCAFQSCGLICIQPNPNRLATFGWGGCTFANASSIPDDPLTKSCGSNLTADAAQGATQVTIASTANLAVNMWVMIDESPQYVSTANPTANGNANILASSDFLTASPSPVTSRLARPDGGCDSNYGLCSTAQNSDRFNHEIHLITAINGNTLTFDSPLTIAFRISNDPVTGHSFDARVYSPNDCSSGCSAVAFMQQAGVENLTVSRATNLPITINFCAYCWVKNVEMSYWVGGASIRMSVRNQITGSFVHNCADCANDGKEYPIAVDAASTEILIDNNITLLGGKGMVGRAGAGSVVAYNYEDWQRYQPGTANDGFLDMSVNGSHEIGTHHFLFEGNRGSNCDNDNTHGNTFYHTYFRNHCAGLRTDFMDPNCNNSVVSDTNSIQWPGCAAGSGNGPLRAFGPMSFDYWLAYVGNVAGVAGISTTANGWVYFRCANGACGNSSETNKTIYMSGWSNPDWKFGDLNLDGTNGPNFFFRNSNFDYVTNGIPAAENPPASFFGQTGFSNALPSSLYLSGAPSYFGTGSTGCTYPWPWVTVNTSPFVRPNSCGNSGLPALARWQAGTPFVQP